MPSLLEINNRVQSIKMELDAAVEHRNITFRFYDNRLFDAGIKAVFSNLKYIMRKDLTYDISNVDEETAKIITEARSLPSYNLANVFVWVRRYMRIQKESNAVHAHHIGKIKKWNEEITEYMEQLCEQPPSKANGRLLNLVGNLQGDLYNEEYGSGAPGEFKSLNGMSWLDLIAPKDFKISKSDFLQLITIDSSVSTLKDITALPSVIDYDALEEAVFINRIEAEGDCYLFDLFFQQFRKVMKEDKAVKEKVHEGLKEMIGPVRTYTVYNDENGQPLYMELNKPKLKVISMVKKED